MSSMTAEDPREDEDEEPQLDEETQKVLDDGLKRYKKAMDELAKR